MRKGIRQIIRNWMYLISYDVTFIELLLILMIIALAAYVVIG